MEQCLLVSRGHGTGDGGRSEHSEEQTDHPQKQEGRQT